MIKVFHTTEELLKALADYIVEHAAEAIAARDRFSFVLSGGGSPKKLFELLVSDDYKNKIEWNKVFFFFGDERYVPSDDPQSNFLMAKKALFEPLAIEGDHVFRMNTDLAPENAARDYEELILKYFEGGDIRFDVNLLGLGDNSHTASLFPYTKVLHEEIEMVSAEFIDEVDMFRITMTAPCINKSANIVFLVFGSGKAEAVRNIIEGERNTELYPAQLIKPNDGELHWFIDEGAAKELTKLKM